MLILSCFNCINIFVVSHEVMLVFFDPLSIGMSETKLNFDRQLRGTSPF